MFHIQLRVFALMARTSSTLALNKISQIHQHETSISHDDDEQRICSNCKKSLSGDNFRRSKNGTVNKRCNACLNPSLARKYQGSMIASPDIQLCSRCRNELPKSKFRVNEKTGKRYLTCISCLNIVNAKRKARKMKVTANTEKAADKQVEVAISALELSASNDENSESTILKRQRPENTTSQPSPSKRHRISHSVSTSSRPIMVTGTLIASPPGLLKPTCLMCDDDFTPYRAGPYSGFSELCPKCRRKCQLRRLKELENLLA